MGVLRQDWHSLFPFVSECGSDPRITSVLVPRCFEPAWVGGGWMIPGPGSCPHLTRLPDGSSEPPRARLGPPELNPLLFKEGRLGWKEGPRTPCTRRLWSTLGRRGTHAGRTQESGPVARPRASVSTSPPRGAPWRDPHTVAAQAWPHRAGPVTAPAYGWGAPRRSAALARGEPGLACNTKQAKLEATSEAGRRGVSEELSPFPFPAGNLLFDLISVAAHVS